MTEFRATYRLQLGGGFGFAAARELVPYLAELGVSHLYLPPSFQARPGSTHGYDVVDPDVDLLRAGRGGGVPCAGGRGARGGARRDPRHRPEPHGGRRREPLLGRAAREVLRRRSGDRQVPALLRHRPPRRRAPGGPGGVRGDAPAGALARARGVGRRAPDRPPGRPCRPRGLSGAAARRRRRARVGGEDPRPGRAAARVVAGGGDGRLRVPQRRRGAVRGPRRPRPPDGPLARPGRRRAALPRVRRGSQAGAGIDDVRRRSATTSRAPPTRRPRGGAVVAAGLPHLHPRRRRLARGPRGAAPRRASSGCSTPRPSSSPASSRRRRR